MYHWKPVINLALYMIILVINNKIEKIIQHITGMLEVLPLVGVYI